MEIVYIKNSEGPVESWSRNGQDVLCALMWAADVRIGKASGIKRRAPLLLF